MKKLITLTAALIIAVSAQAQYKIQVSEANESFSTGSQNALVVTVYEAKADDVEKNMKKLFKDWGGNIKTKDEVFGDDCSMKKMGKNTFDAYGKCVQEDKNVKVIIAIDLGGAYMSSSQHKEQFDIIKEEVYKFGVDQTKEAIGAIVKTEEGKLKDLEKQRDDIVKDTEDQKKAIEDYKKKITEAEEKIKKNDTDKETKIKEIGEQQKVVEEVKKKQEAVK
jgi:uncharacterized protein HemX